MRFTSAVILAAGSGTRFGSDTKKQYVSVNGRSSVVRCAEAFDSCSLIDEIVFVGEPEELNLALCNTKLKKKYTIVSGGSTRQESALNGFDAISPKAKYVAIHDAARCLVTPEIIEDTVKSAYKYRSAAAAERVIDTVKIANEDGFIEETADRDLIWLVKTPQVFLADIYRASAYTAKKEAFLATDDCMLCERVGFKIKLVDCGSDNIKLTSQDDLGRAVDILRRRGENII